MYQVFRAKFLYVYLLGNAIMAAVIQYIYSSSSNTDPADVNFTFLEGYALTLAGMMLFKIFFAFLYTMQWNFRRCCSKKYKIPRKVDQRARFKKQR